MDEQNSIPTNAEIDLVELSSDIVCAYVSHNELEPNDVAKFITDVHATLKTLRSAQSRQPELELKPAVSIRKSVT